MPGACALAAYTRGEPARRAVDPIAYGSLQDVA